MARNRFSYGDRIRRRSGGPERVVRDIGQEAYHFTDGTFALIDDQDCYVMVEKHSGFFRVMTDVDGAPLSDYLRHGYETRSDFRDALVKITAWWGGRTGEFVGSRYDHLRLKFHDTPGGRPDEAWIPLYLLEPVPLPDYMRQEETDPFDEELDRILGFD